MINVILVEDHHIVRNALKMLIETDEQILIVGEAGDGQRALDILSENDQIDLILTDLNMPVLDGIALATAVTKSGSKAKVMILSMHDKETFILKAFKAGAAAYLLKNINAEELLFAIRYVYTGGRYICASLSMNMVDNRIKRSIPEKDIPVADLDLSAREEEILHMIADGVTNQGVSERLFLSRRTVEGHRQSLIDKFSVSNTAELIRSAMRLGYIN